MFMTLIRPASRMVCSSLTTVSLGNLPLSGGPLHHHDPSRGSSSPKLRWRKLQYEPLQLTEPPELDSLWLGQPKFQKNSPPLKIQTRSRPWVFRRCPRGREITDCTFGNAEHASSGVMPGFWWDIPANRHSQGLRFCRSPMAHAEHWKMGVWRRFYTAILPQPVPARRNCPTTVGCRMDTARIGSEAQSVGELNRWKALERLERWNFG